MISSNSNDSAIDPSVREPQVCQKQTRAVFAAIFCIGLLLSILASVQIKRRLELDEATRLSVVSDQIKHIIRERLGAYALVLRGAAGLFAASGEVSREEWNHYVRTLHVDGSVPGVQGIGFSQVIQADELNAHIQRIQEQGFPRYAVWPAGERSRYTAIIYLEPFRDRNLRAFGYDMYSEPIRRRAMDQACDTGEAALSGKVELVQETGAQVQAGALMYVPVYRNRVPVETVEQKRSALIGWAYSPYRMDDLMDGILSDMLNQAQSAMCLHIYAGPEASSNNLLYASSPNVSHDSGRFGQQRRTLNFNQQQWLLLFDRSPTLSGLSYVPAWTVLWGGVLLSGLLSGLILSLIITRHKAKQIAWHLSQERQAASVFIYAREGIMITGADGTILNVNDAFTRITGYSREDVIGQNPRLLSSGLQDPHFYATMRRELAEKGLWAGEVWNKRKSGELYAEALTITVVRNADLSSEHYVALFTDITATKQHQDQLEHLAHFDALTSLPTRMLMADRLRQAMEQADGSGSHLALVYLDLDGFKAINDQYGHAVGDQLLIAFAARMKMTLRAGDTLARLGGDEFVAILVDLKDLEASIPVLQDMLATAAQVVHVGHNALKVSASLGVSFYPQNTAVVADHLLRQADQAMYQAKLAGKNGYYVFDPQQDNSIRARHEDLERIRLAESQHEFVLHYQPKVNMRTGHVIGVEALIRWRHPQRGLLMPASFLPTIEDHPLAVRIGEWVIDSVLTQMEIWHAAGLDMDVSVNVAARQLQDIHFVERLRAVLAAHPQVNPVSLSLELVETSALEDMPCISQVIEDCAQIGVTCALDDFGTGYSSLTYLRRLQVTLIKIDQSFVRDMIENPADRSILRGVISLAKAFNRQVIAEGVESQEQGVLLLQLGCHLAQGYGIARPMPADAIPGWVASWRPEPVWTETSVLSDSPFLSP